MILRQNEQLGWMAGRFQTLRLARRTNTMTVKVPVSSLSASPSGLKTKAKVWLEKDWSIQFWSRGKVESFTHSLLRGHRQDIEAAMKGDRTKGKIMLKCLPAYFLQENLIHSAKSNSPGVTLCGLHAICDRAMAMTRKVSVLFVLVCMLQLGTPADAVVVGGPRPIEDSTNNLEIDELANFAVDQYKSHLNSISDVSFSKVLAAKEQVVQGTMYYLTVEVIEDGVPKQYEVKVWVKPWESFKELESFLPSAPSHFDNAVDLTAKSKDLKKEKIGA